MIDKRKIAKGVNLLLYSFILMFLGPTIFFKSLNFIFIKILSVIIMIGACLLFFFGILILINGIFHKND